MDIKLLTKRHLEAAQACLSLFMSKYHIVGNLMSRLNLMIVGRSKMFAQEKALLAFV